MHVPLISHIAGLIANISSNIAFIPQIIKSYRRKKVEDVSISMFVVLFTTQICWIVYAVPIGAENLWISSLIEIVLLLPLFVMWFFYKTYQGITLYHHVCRMLKSWFGGAKKLPDQSDPHWQHQ